MKIALIGRKDMTEFARTLARAKYVTVEQRPSRFFSILFLCVWFRPDVFHFYDGSPRLMTWILKIFCPRSVVIKDPIREPVPVRRVTTDDFVLAPMKLRSYSYVLVSPGIDQKSQHLVRKAWDVATSDHPDVFQNLKLAMVHDVRGEVRKALFAGAKFVVHPSATPDEASILEAMSHGKAVVAQNSEMIREYGVPFMAGDAINLAHTMTELVKDPMQTIAIGHVARAFVELDYNIERIALETCDMYRDIISKYGTDRQGESENAADARAV